MRQDFLTIYGEPNASVSKFVVPNGTNPTAEEDGESVLDEDLLLGVGRAGENWYWVSNGWMPASRLDRNSSRAICAGFRKFDRNSSSLQELYAHQFVPELGNGFRPTVVNPHTQGG